MIQSEAFAHGVNAIGQDTLNPRSPRGILAGFVGKSDPAYARFLCTGDNDCRV
jgi:hypothetical protein